MISRIHQIHGSLRTSRSASRPHRGQYHHLHHLIRNVSNTHTQYIRGGSLEVLLADKSQTLDWKTRITLTKDIALGMSYLHHKLIMHRDLTSKVCTSDASDVIIANLCYIIYCNIASLKI